MKTRYIIELGIKEQNEIIKELREKGLSEEDIVRAVNSRLCDLDDTINIERYL